MPSSLILWRLPRRVKYLIYEHLGFVGNDIDLNYIDLPIYPADQYPEDEYVHRTSCFHNFQSTISRREDYRSLEEYWESDHDRQDIRDYQELCVNRTCEGAGGGSCLDWINHFYDRDFIEFSTTVWENNHFRICSGSAGGYQSLLELTPDKKRTAHAISRIRNLTIRIDGEPPESINLGGDWKRLETLIPLNRRSRYGETALRNWTTFIRQLAELILPGHLNLYIIAATTDIRTAEAILDPLKHLPTLKGLGVWLNKKPIPKIIALIKQTIEYRTSDAISAHAMPFRYLDLPYELRLRILESTDIVYDSDREWQSRISSTFRLDQCNCPSKANSEEEVEVIKHHPGCIRKQLDPDFDLFRDQHQRPSTCISKHCDFCSARSIIEACKLSMSGVCICIFHCKHSAHSSTLYRPRGGAHPLFLVSRRVRQDAIPVFFQRNRLTILPHNFVSARYGRGCITNPDNYTFSPIQRLELPIFLSMLPKGAMQHIRYMEWVIPQPLDYLKAPRAASLDYLAAIDMMTKKMNLNRLTLVLNFRVNWWELGYYPDLYPWAERSDEYGAAYDFILQPLRRLVGLKRCFVYLRRIRRGPADSAGDVYVYDRDEMRYEKAIMGEQYDSAKRGKPWNGRMELHFELGYDHVRMYGDYV